MYRKLIALRCRLENLAASGKEGWNARSTLSKAALLLIGFLALCWFCLRVIPKPSRAGYPCQRAAFPLATTFVLWVLSLFALGGTSRLFMDAARTRRYFMAVGALSVAIVLSFYTVGMPNLSLLAAPQVVSVTPNAPVGEAKGVNPGRVVWVHDPEATQWAGDESGEEWWQPQHTSMPIVQAMFDRAIKELAGADNLKDAWHAMIVDFNIRQGRGNIGYSAGEKIMIKTNLTTTAATLGNIDPHTLDKRKNNMWYDALYDNIDPSPQVTLALLRHLVHEVGVAESDITIGDTLGRLPKRYFDVFTAEFPDIVYLDNQGDMGRTAAAFSNKTAHWSTSRASRSKDDFVPSSYAKATYLINLAVPKTHALAGITACAKNHFGSMLRTPVGALYGQSDSRYYDWHTNLADVDNSSNRYHVLVDLMGHPDIGGKTLLCVLDTLYSAKGWDAVPSKWQSAPFNNDWPSSIIVSQDQVAIDSVAYDLLRMEWPEDVEQYGDATQDYLLEAALAHNPPSGSTYDPDGDGKALASLGTYEHWNNDTDRQYSRNLGTGNGIELVYHKTSEARPQDSIVSRTAEGVNEVHFYFENMLPGQSYTILGKSSLTSPIWSTLDSGTTTGYGIRYTRDSSSSIFFRVVMQD